MLYQIDNYTVKCNTCSQKTVRPVTISIKSAGHKLLGNHVKSVKHKQIADELSRGDLESGTTQSTLTNLASLDNKVIK